MGSDLIIVAGRPGMGKTAFALGVAIENARPPLRDDSSVEQISVAFFSLEMSDELNPKGYTLAVVSDESRCLNCGLCDILCPEFAIHLESNDNES